MNKTEKEIEQAGNEIRKNTSLQIQILQKHGNVQLGKLQTIHRRCNAEHSQMKSKIDDHILKILELNSKCQLAKNTTTEQFRAEDFQQLQDACESIILRTNTILSTNVAHKSPIHYVPNSRVFEVLESLHIGKIEELVTDPSRCSIECGEPLTRCGFMKEFSIVTRDSKGDKCCTNKTLIDVNIQDNDGNDVQKEITESQPGHFAVKFRVEKSLTYNIVVSIGGQNIKNSPQTISAIDAKAEFKPVRFFQTSWTSLPVTLAIHGKGDMTATVNNAKANECCAMLYNADCDSMREVGAAGKVPRRGQLSNPWGLAFPANDDHILVSDNTDDGGCIREYHKQKRMLFTRMCISGQSIACLSYNERNTETSVMLFSKESHNHLGDIKLHAANVKTEPLFLTYANSKYFVSFYNNHSVHAFDENGVLLHMIGEKGDKEGQFKDPRGLAVFGADMLLVCDAGNHRVQLFHQDGVFIRSFGSPGSDLGHMHWPIDVAVTSDGHIFVLELDGYRIQVFK